MHHSEPNPAEVADPPAFTLSTSSRPEFTANLVRADLLLTLFGLISLVLRHGVESEAREGQFLLGGAVVLVMLLLTISLGLRYRWSLVRDTFRRENFLDLVVVGGWALTSLLGLLAFGIFSRTSSTTEIGSYLVQWSELVLLGWSGVSFVQTLRELTGRGINPAVLLAGSFVILILVGTLLLMLPRSRTVKAVEFEATQSRVQIALFTATSASCVTGLAVVPTAEYWSRFGQGIILVLFQVGGLGIMTCGAFFLLASANGVGIRERATLKDLLDSDTLGSVKQLLTTIFLFTMTAELVGAVGFLSLFADHPLPDRIFLSAFHSVSAFCNAGFSLTDNSFVGMEHRWEIWGVASGLIIAGGLGFSVIYNLAKVTQARVHDLRARRDITATPASAQMTRMLLTTRLVLATTVALLLFGMAGYFLLESLGVNASKPFGTRLANAWFQSVTFRTAGFNTVDHGALQPGTKLFALVLMFIGAAPGSTGGGIKTVCFAVALLALYSTLRGRPRVEIAGRTIPETSIYKSLSIISLGLLCVFVTTILLTLFEPSDANFLNLLFEAMSAFATVGVSTGITADLSASSKYLLVVTMFLGRVGPLTLMLALARQLQHSGHYIYPEERVLLG